jgi:acyl-coenzyme A synthetase/AMP-(fatty) acid ligase
MTAVAERIEQLFRESPAERAVQYDRAWFTWGDLRDVRDALDRILELHGAGPGAAVGLVLRERPSGLASLLALLSTERCAVLVTPIQPDAPMGEDVADLKLTALIADHQDWQRTGLKEAAASAGTLGIEIGPDMAKDVRIVEGLDRASSNDRYAAGDGVAMMILTSGTTGPPKRVPLSYAALDLGERVPAGRPGGGRGVAINALPLVSIGGALGVVGTVYRGRPIALMDRFDVHKWAELVKEHRPRRLGAPPATIRAILDADIPVDYLASGESFVAASAAVDLATTDEFEARYGIPVLRGYGATEFLGGVTSWTLDEYRQVGADKRGSVGRALPGVRLRVVDPETGNEVAATQVGVLEVTPARRPVGVPDGWIRTTDLASLDEDGYLWIHGRADDVIIRGGFKVSTGEVADVLREHPMVSDAAVVGLPDRRLGEVPGAAVVLAPGTETSVTQAELTAWVKDRLPPYKVPVRMAIVPALPRNAMMKVVIPQVQELLAP